MKPSLRVFIRCRRAKLTRSRITPQLAWLVYCIVLGVLVTGYMMMHVHDRWTIQARNPGAIAFGPGYLAMEPTDFFGERRWFRHVQNQTPIGIPNLSAAHVVSLNLLTRSEEPPQSIVLTNGQHSIALPTQPQSWQIHLYVPANTTYHVECDNSLVTSSYNQRFCLSVVHINGRATTTPVTSSYLVYLIMPLSWLLLIGAIVSVGNAPMRVRTTVMLIATSVIPMLIEHYGLQLHMWRWGITGALILATVAVLMIRAITTSYRAIGAITVGALVIKLLGFMTPGARFADLSIHITQFENVLLGNLYQQMQGTISHDLIYQNQIQTYPYPPLAYMVVAPFALFTESIFTSGQAIGILAILIEASLVAGVVWLARRMRFSWSATIIAALTYVALPQSFILQNHTAAAQVIGQWAGWVFVLVAVAAGPQLNTRNTLLLMLMALITSAGHFGALLTTSIVQGFHLLIGKLRAAAWIWFGVVASISLIYYSQFITLILSQLQFLTRDTAISRWGELMMIVNMGVFDHYSAIIFVLGVIATLHTRFRRNKRIWSIWLAAFATFGLFTLLRVGFFVSPTRYVIMVSPLIALGLGSICAGYIRSRAGQLMVIALLGYQIITAIDAWATYKIGHHLVRWIVPQ